MSFVGGGPGGGTGNTGRITMHLKPPERAAAGGRR